MSRLKNSVYLLLLAKYLKKVGRIDAYVKTLDEIIQAYPTFVDILVEKSKFLHKKGDLEQALELTERALVSNPSSGR